MIDRDAVGCQWSFKWQKASKELEDKAKEAGNRKTLGIFEALWKQGPTLVAITHNVHVPERALQVIKWADERIEAEIPSPAPAFIKAVIQTSTRNRIFAVSPYLTG